MRGTRQHLLVADAAALLALVSCGCGSAERVATKVDAGQREIPDSSAAASDAPVPSVDAPGAAADAQAPLPDGRASNAPADAASRCTVTAAAISCDQQVLMVDDATGPREVAYATPLGTPPAGGWPVVVYFQGSFTPGHTAFSATSLDPFGMYWLTLTIDRLLADGYAVLAPDAIAGGTTFWETNIPPYAIAWTGCSDDVLMHNLLGAIAKGSFGPIDTARRYAMGISSGGFMTSRMAVSYAGQFRALVDSAGSYATCSAACLVPTPLPADHPPTLFLHGDTDPIVPMSSVQPYLDALKSEGHETKLVTDPMAGHQWLPEGPDVIPAWFDAHR